MAININPPTRAQWAKIANGDQRVLLFFEQLSESIKTGGDADLGALSEQVSLLEAAPKPNAVQISGKQDIIRSLETGEFVFVADASDFPVAIGGIISLSANASYFVTSHIDLMGDRLFIQANVTLFGAGTGTCSITSTGLLEALISGSQTVSLRNLSITASLVFNLSGAGETVNLVDVHFVNCPDMGTASTFSSVFIDRVQFISSGDLVFNGTIGTISISNTVFEPSSGTASILLSSSATIEGVLSIAHSEFNVASGADALNISTSASVPASGYILDKCRFVGAGNYLSGVQSNDEKALFSDNAGISNSATASNYHMTGNVVATSIATMNTPVKAAGVTSSGPITQRFANTDNRAEYEGVTTEMFRVGVTAVLLAASGVKMAMYVAKNGTVINHSQGVKTSDAAGRGEGAQSIVSVQLASSDNVEIWVENQTGTENITVENLNVIIERMAA